MRLDQALDYSTSIVVEKSYAEIRGNSPAPA